MSIIYKNNSDIFQQHLELSVNNLILEQADEPFNTEIKSGVYLVQPAVLRTSNRYKFGMATTNIDRRIKAYKVGTKILCKYYCDNPIQIENALKITFADHIYSGNEYIEHSDETQMITAFKEVVSRFISIDDN